MARDETVPTEESVRHCAGLWFRTGNWSAESADLPCIRPLGKRQVVPSSSAACFGCTAMRCGCEVFAKRGSSVEDVPPEPGISAQNKTPQTQLSHGTLVDQPSPKCCSKTTLNRSRS